MTSLRFAFSFTVAALAVTASVQTAVPSPPRLRERFDADWRFERGPEIERTATGPFAWEWHPMEAQSVDAAPTLDGEWRPYTVGAQVLSGRTRYGVFRTELGGGPLAGRLLHVEAVDDNAVLYLNGKRVGKQVGYGVPFDVTIADAWNPQGPNRLVVLVENEGGDGGLSGAVTLENPDAPESQAAEVRPGFDDTVWRTVHLPHDYVVEGVFKPTEEVNHGFLPRPAAWYRRTFVAPSAWRGKSVWIDFDGVYRNSDVYLNGKKLGHQSSGYIGFRYDLSKGLDYGAANVIAVHIDPRKDEGWWYEGAGIYRHVWMNVADPVHVAPDGLFARAEVVGGSAEVKVTTEVANDSAEDASLVIESRILDPSGKLVGTLKNAEGAGPGKKTAVTGTTTVANPLLWDLKRPNLYRVITTVKRDGRIVDTQEASFGIRTILFDKDRGFLLNGKRVELQGTCNHQDHAGTGIGMPDALLAWRLAQLKKMGCNAYRCSHNPPAAELLDACDRMGILVMDETRHLGDATQPKSPRGTTADDLTELRAMVRRDRNHPSIILWSLYNEEPLQGSKEGADLFVKMRKVVDALDGTRPSSGATNYGFEGGIVDVARVYGMNYSPGQYDNVRASHPDLPLFGSETVSAVSTRGEYANDREKGYVSAYDVNTLGHGATLQKGWQAIADRPWMAGSFAWTGFDYKGEPDPYKWPNVNGHLGSLDIAGFPKDDFYYYQSVWTDAPMVHVFPSWNWAGKEGQPIAVWAYSNGDAVELFLNGKSLGEKAMPRLGHVEWSVPYAPGVLEARATQGGKPFATDRVETTGAPAALRLRTDRTKILGDHEDLSVVQVEVVDAQGRVVPDAVNEVTFTITGAAAGGGVGNGNPSDHDPDKADHRRAFHGRCMVLVQSNGGVGAIRLTASAKGLKPATLEMAATPSKQD